MKYCIVKQAILLFIILFSHSLLFSQGKFEISGGLGLPEYFNIKLKYGGTFQAGTGLGWHKDQYVNKFYISGDCYYHFAKSKISDLKTWYINSGITYEPVNHSFDTREKSLFFYSRCGRSFNFTKHMGIKLDLGFMLGNVWTIRFGMGPGSAGRVLSDTKEFYFYPAGSISYFIRL